jgi:hypothetical protein
MDIAGDEATRRPAEAIGDGDHRLSCIAIT